MVKLSKILGTLGIIGLSLVGGILCLSYPGLRYGIYIGMNSDDADLKLRAQGFLVDKAKSEFTEETAAKYFRKGHVSIGIHWSYELTPQTPPGLISHLTVEEALDR